MSTVMAESFVGEALRDYLLRKLPAKVDSINAARAAVLKAPRVGPYTVVGNSVHGRRQPRRRRGRGQRS
jgi:hypothetical protein